MKKNLTNLAASDMEQLLTKLEQSWRYPLRMIGSVDQEQRTETVCYGKQGQLPVQKNTGAGGALSDRI